MKRRDRRELERLLSARNEHPERLPEIDHAIRERFAETRAVLVLDMCRFSRLSLRYGIIHFLAMIQRLHETAGPIFMAFGGRVLKKEADDLFCVFPDVPQALDAAVALKGELEAMDAVLPEDWDLQVSMGIGYGEILLIDDGDLYGCEVNVASKLGEEIAGEGEILLTEAAWERVPGRGGSFIRQQVEVSGLRLVYYVFR